MPQFVVMQDQAQATLQAALVVLAQLNHVGAAEGKCLMKDKV